jgi:hypothetical protein
MQICVGQAIDLKETPRKNSVFGISKPLNGKPTQASTH